jgi:hypothetical protein
LRFFQRRGIEVTARADSIAAKRIISQT